MLRLRLKSTAPCSGDVDGAWWPRSDDLTAELRDLIAVLSGRLGAVESVSYNLGEWTTTPAKVFAGKREIRLDGSHRQPSNTVKVVDAQGDTMILLVVPSHTDPDTAHAIVIAAAGTSNVSSVDDLLLISEQERESRTRRTAAQNRWESQAEAR